MIGRPRRRGILGPAVLILVGVVALAVNAGLVTDAAMARLNDLWPMLLIVMGAWIVLPYLLPPRTAAIAGILIASVALVGAIVYAAIGPPAVRHGDPGARSDQSPGRTTNASLEMP